MQIRLGEKDIKTVKNETVNGLNIAVNLISDAVNKDLPLTSYNDSKGFDASNVHVDVILKRDGKTFNMISTNLGILGHFYTQLKGESQWLRGVTTVKKGAAVRQEQTRTLFIPFFGHHNIKGSDELIVTVNCARDTFGEGVSDQSTLLVTTNQSIGVETAIYKLNTHAISSNQNELCLYPNLI